MATTAWKGLLSFGLVSIPIRLYTAARPKRTQLHQLHKKCHTRLKQPLYCPTCNRIVDRSEVVKGYEYEKGRYAIVDDEELKKITPASGKTMEIEAFVHESEVDPIYFDSSFLSVPEVEGRKGYALLLKVLEESEMLGIAKVTMHQREYTVFIRPRKHGLTLHTMYYADEIASVAGYGEAENTPVKPQEVKLAEQLVKTLTTKFKPEQYHDEHQEKLKALVEAKSQGKEVVAEEAAPQKGRVIDMMEALKRSLAQNAKNKPAPAAAAATGKQRRRAAS